MFHLTKESVYLRFRWIRKSYSRKCKPPNFSIRNDKSLYLSSSCECVHAWLKILVWWSCWDHLCTEEVFFLNRWYFEDEKEIRHALILPILRVLLRNVMGSVVWLFVQQLFRIFIGHRRFQLKCCHFSIHVWRISTYCWNSSYMAWKWPHFNILSDPFFWWMKFVKKLLYFLPAFVSVFFSSSFLFSFINTSTFVSFRNPLCPISGVPGTVWDFILILVVDFLVSFSASCSLVSSFFGSSLLLSLLFFPPGRKVAGALVFDRVHFAVTFSSLHMLDESPKVCTRHNEFKKRWTLTNRLTIVLCRIGSIVL